MAIFKIEDADLDRFCSICSKAGVKIIFGNLVNYLIFKKQISYDDFVMIVDSCIEREFRLKLKDTRAIDVKDYHIEAEIGIKGFESLKPKILKDWMKKYSEEKKIALWFCDLEESYYLYVKEEDLRNDLFNFHTKICSNSS